MEKNATAPSVEVIARECIAVRLRIANRILTGVYDEALRAHGIKVSQMNILVAISRFGTAKPGDVCGVLHMDPSTLSRNVDRMRARGWLEAVPGGDGRTHLLRLTPEGSRLLRDAVPAWRSAQQKAASMLGEQGVEAVNRIAECLRSKVEA